MKVYIEISSVSMAGGLAQEIMRAGAADVVTDAADADWVIVDGLDACRKYYAAKKGVIQYLWDTRLPKATAIELADRRIQQITRRSERFRAFNVFAMNGSFNGTWALITYLKRLSAPQP